MARDDYFENDDNIVSRKSVADSIKPVFSSLLGKINEQRAAQAEADAERKRARQQRTPEPSFPEDLLDLINADADALVADISRQAEESTHRVTPAKEEEPVRAPEKSVAAPAPPIADEVITVRARARAHEYEEENEDLVDAIKAFSHKSGDAISSVAHTIKEGTIAVAAVIEEKEKSSSRLHRAIVIFLMLLLTVAIFAGMIAVFMHQMTAENKRMALFNTEAGKVCTELVRDYGAPSYENLYTTYGVDGYRLTGLCFVREMDFDNDGTAELMVAYNKNGAFYNEVWGFTDKDEFKVLFSEKTAQSDDKAKDAYSTIYRKNNKYYIALHDEKKPSKMALYQLKGDGFTKRYDCKYDSKTQSYAVDGKDDTTAFEQIKYAVFKNEKAIAESEKAARVIEGFSGESAVAKITDKQSLKNAYYDIVQDYNKRYGVAKYTEKNGAAYIDGLAVVKLIDFDGDGTKELLLVYRKPIKVRNEASNDFSTYEVETYYCEVYRYTGTKAALAYTGEGISAMDDDGKDRYIIIKRDGKKSYYCTNTFSFTEYGRHISAGSTIYAFDGTGFTADFSASYETDYGYTEYYLDGEEVRKSTFEEAGYQVALFDGDTQHYDSKIYQVTYLQRALSDKGGLNAIPAETEKVIQKLNPAYTAN